MLVMIVQTMNEHTQKILSTQRSSKISEILHELGEDYARNQRYRDYEGKVGTKVPCVGVRWVL